MPSHTAIILLQYLYHTINEFLCWLKADLTEITVLALMADIIWIMSEILVSHCFAVCETSPTIPLWKVWILL